MHAETEIDIQGISGELKENVELYIGQPVNDSERNIAAFADKLPSEVRDALQALGYYNSKISVERSTLTRKDTTAERITVTVERGPAVKVTNMEIRLKGDVNTNGDQTFRKMLDDLPLQKGDTLNHGLYEKTKSQLFNTAQDRGYFDASFVETSARVDRQTNSASILLVFDSGRRYKFGEVSFDTDFFNVGFLERWVPFETGDPYELDLIAKLTQELQSSGYFSRVRVRTLRDQPVDGHIPIEVTLNTTEANKVGLGVG
ncbi:MAG: hypothetical protein KDJ38_17000, partial [Gammaproteobacteria bacterium]|nr:hypothetical protein [Gammaproteobacteria bacterium]